MAQKVIDTPETYTTPKLMMQAIDDNFDELYEESPSVGAYISVPAPTTIIAAGTYYPIEGTFVNTLVGFEAATVVTPGIKYTGTRTRKFKILLQGQVEADRLDTVVTIAVYKNGVLIAGSNMSGTCRNADDPYPIGVISDVSLATGDEIQLVVTSDGAGDEVTFDNLQTAINVFG